MTEIIKYTYDDIERIFEERVKVESRQANLKAGIISEWTFEYPNGTINANVEYSYPVDEKSFDYTIGLTVCKRKIMQKLWEICGQYSLITGKKL